MTTNTCSFCGETPFGGGRLVNGNGGAAICKPCAIEAVDFFGATAKMEPSERPSDLYPRQAWDHRVRDAISD